MFEHLKTWLNKPPLYFPSSHLFWNDEHISKGMLKAHLDPALDSASRTLGFIKKSVKWITDIAPVQDYPSLLDLGCGPGIYTELFDDEGYKVTGMDLSKRSLAHARASAEKSKKDIRYEYANYLMMSYREVFDIITLIYCDLGALSSKDRTSLLASISAALKDGGLCIFDVFTSQKHAAKKESTRWGYQESGFWSSAPHLCLESFYRYDEDATILKQYIIITDDGSACYNIWEHMFTLKEIQSALKDAGLRIRGVYADVAGKTFAAHEDQFCIVAEKI